MTHFHLKIFFFLSCRRSVSYIVSVILDVIAAINSHRLTSLMVQKAATQSPYF